MRPLSDTISRLGALRQARERILPTDIPDRLADVADFGSNPGALRARTFIPPGLPAGSPLVVVLHGCTQSAAEYDHGSGWSDLALADGFALLYAEQRPANNPSLCFNWFQPGDTRRDAGEVLSIRQMIDKVATDHRIDRSRIYINGLSAGGGMASAMLAAYPEIFAGGAILAGLPYGVANTIPEAFDRMRGHGLPPAATLQVLLRNASGHKGPWPTISVWQGTADQTVNAGNAEAIVQQWMGVHAIGPGSGRSSDLDGHRRTVWTDGEGRECIEQVLIAGMGHGTPIRVAEPDSCGRAGPYMLDVGISSTLHLARSWGLSPAIARKRIPTTARTPEPAAAHGTSVAALEKNLQEAAAAATQTISRSAQGIQKVIEDALRQAGLMK